MNADVFISHADSDSKIAHAVCARLEARGIRCWIASRDIEPGRSWPKAVLRAIKTTRVMVVILSQKANESPHVYREVERAVNDGDAILPFRIEDVEPSENMGLFLGSCHWLDAISPPVDEHIQELGARIESLLELNPPDSSSRRARESLIKAAGHMPKAPHRVSLKYLIGTGLIAGLTFAAAVALVFLDSAAPILHSPANDQLIIEPGLTFEWEYDAGSQSGIIYQLLQTYDGTDPDMVSVVEPGHSTVPKMPGSIKWQVKAMWKDGDKDQESDWSDARVVTWYPDTLAKVRATNTLNVAIAEEAVRFIKPNKEVTGFELEFLRRALTSHLGGQGEFQLKIVHSNVFPFDQSFVDSLKGSDWDVMVGGISITDERRTSWNVEFTEPLYSYPQSFVYLKNQNNPICLGGAEAGTECRIGVKSGTTNEELADRLEGEYQNVAVVPYKGASVYDAMARDLRDRNLELALMDEPYALELLKLQYKELLEHVPIEGGVIGNAPPPEQIGIATKIFDDELRAVLNAAIPELTPEVNAFLAGLGHREGSEVVQPPPSNTD